MEENNHLRDRSENPIEFLEAFMILAWLHSYWVRAF